MVIILIQYFKAISIVRNYFYKFCAFRVIRSFVIQYNANNLYGILKLTKLFILLRKPFFIKCISSNEVLF